MIRREGPFSPSPGESPPGPNGFSPNGLKISPALAGVLRQESRGVERRESDISLTLSRRSSQAFAPPSKIDRSRLARRLSALATRQAKQNFSEQEQKTMSKFSSLNYAPTHSLTFMRWLGTHHGYALVQVQRWLLCCMIGVVTGVVAWLLKQCTQALLAFKWNRTKELIGDGQLLDAWGWNCAVSVGFAAISAFLVVVIYPPAVGGGTPEVIAFLNGILVHDALAFKNLLVKFLSLVFSVASNMPVGTQGPLISYGAIIGAGVGDFRSKALGFSPNVFTRFRNSEDRREFTTAGVAAGVAAGFSAPVGGLLFAMEDLSSFWGRRIAWQTFFCATVATAVAQMLNRAFISFRYQGSFGRLETAVVAPTMMHIISIFIALFMGLIGGILGAIFTHLNSLVKRYRKRIFGSIPYPSVTKVMRITDCMIFAAIMSVYGTLLPLGFSCSEIVPSDNGDLSSDCIWSNVTTLSLSPYTCDVYNSTEDDLFAYNDVASLVSGGSGWTYLDHLWSTNTSDQYSWEGCMSIFILWFVLTISTAGASVAGGIFLPICIGGALYGRAVGIGVRSIFSSVTGSPPSGSLWHWVDPGLFAVMGSASLLGGVTRLSLATTVIIIEMSNDLDLIIPIMITNFTAKLVGDTLAKPLFVNDLNSKLLPFLAQEPQVPVNDHIVNLELYKARDVMTSPVWTINSCETVSALAKLLIETDHEGFPVVKYDECTFTELAYGMITRTELYVILCSSEVYDETRPGTTVAPEISYDELSVDFIQDPETAIERVRSYTRFAVHNSIFVDLEPFINISAPKVDEDYSLHRTYQIFRTLGLRHLMVIDIHNQVVGIITRQDLLPFYIQRRLEERTRPVNRGEENQEDDETVLPAITVKLSVVSEKEFDSEEGDHSTGGHANPAFLPDSIQDLTREQDTSHLEDIVNFGKTQL